MAGETVSPDYLAAAVDFGTSLGGGVLSTLSNTGTAVVDTAAQGAGYLTSLSPFKSEAEKSASEERAKVGKKETVINPTTTSPASLESSSALRFDNLTNGNTLLKSSPSVFKTMSGIGDTVSNTVRYGTTNFVSPTITNLSSLGASLLPSVPGTISTTKINPSSASISGGTVMNINDINIMRNPQLPFISDASKIITPYASSALEMAALGATQLKGGVNSIIFDKGGKALSYTGAGAQKLVSDIEFEKKNFKQRALESGEMIDPVMKGIQVAQSKGWDASYLLGGNTGFVESIKDKDKSDTVTKTELEQIIDRAPNLAISKIKTKDGNMIVRWKPQENPSVMPTYAKDKEFQLYNKGESYITEGIPDNLKYQTYKVDTSASGDVSSAATYIPGVSNMFVKGLKLKPTVKSGQTEIEAESLSTTISDGTFDPDKKKKSMNDIASNYTYIQGGLSNAAILKEKSKKNPGTVFRKKSVISPKIILVHSLRNQMNNVTSRINRKHVSKVMNMTPVTKSNKELPFIQRKPDVNFKVSAAMKGMSGVANNIESFISLNGSNNKLVEKSNFNFDLDNMLCKPNIDLGLGLKKRKKSK